MRLKLISIFLLIIVFLVVGCGLSLVQKTTVERIPAVCRHKTFMACLLFHEKYKCPVRIVDGMGTKQRHWQGQAKLNGIWVWIDFDGYDAFITTKQNFTPKYIWSLSSALIMMTDKKILRKVNVEDLKNGL